MLNLRNIKTVGFIPDFNRRGSYPEFGIQLPIVVELPKADVQMPAKVIRRKLGNVELINAKKAFNRAKSVDYKPQLLVSTKF